MRQYLVEFGVIGIRSRRRLQVLDGLTKALGPVVTETQQRCCLQIIRISCRSGMERSHGCLKVSLLEIREPQIELHSRQLRIQGERFFVGRRRFPIFSFFRQNHAKARESRGVAGILLDDGLPSLGCLGKLSLSLKSDGGFRIRRLGVQAARQQTNRDQERRCGPFRF